MLFFSGFWVTALAVLLLLMTVLDLNKVDGRYMCWVALSFVSFISISGFIPVGIPLWGYHLSG